MSYQAIIESNLNDLLSRNGQASLKGKAIHYASDDSVSCEDWTIRKSNILNQDSINNFLETKAEGRDWIHANLIQTDKNDYLITVRVGSKVGNPNPSVNVSFEPNHLVKIIS
jgi:hypothetical protein